LARPLSVADVRLDRDQRIPRDGLTHGGNLAHDVFLLQLLYKLADELVRHRVATGAVWHEHERAGLGPRQPISAHQTPEGLAPLLRAGVNALDRLWGIAAHVSETARALFLLLVLFLTYQVPLPCARKRVLDGLALQLVHQLDTLDPLRQRIDLVLPFVPL